MRRNVVHAVTFSIAAAACQPASTELTEEHRAAMADSVIQLSLEMQRAFDNKDAAYFDYLSDWSTSSAAGERFLEANRANVEDNLWANTTQTVELGETRTLVLSLYAVVVERAQVNIITDSNGEIQENDALLSELWVREDTGWQAVVYKFTMLGAREPS